MRSWAASPTRGATTCFCCTRWPPEAEIYSGWTSFRDYRRQHPDDARAYDALKQPIVAEGKADGWRYQQAKTPFLTALVEKSSARPHLRAKPAGEAQSEL